MTSNATPSHHPSPFGVQILNGLDQKLINRGVHEVFLDLPQSRDMTWAVNSAANMANCEGFKLRVGTRQDHAVFLYFPKNFNEHGNTRYPPIQQEFENGDPVENKTNLIWASADITRQWMRGAPFKFMWWVQNDSRNKHPFFAVVSFYFMCAGISDNGVKRPEFEDSFLRALEDIKNSQGYQDWKASRPNGVGA